MVDDVLAAAASKIVLSDAPEWEKDHNVGPNSALKVYWSIALARIFNKCWLFSLHTT